MARLNGVGVRRTLAALCAALTLVQPASATVRSVTDTADPGTLRTAVTSAVSGDVIQWGPGSGGTITLGSDLPALTGGVTLDATAAPSAATIAGAPNGVSLGGAVTLFNDNAGQAFTVSAPVKGAGSLFVGGKGALDLLGVNTFTGGLTLSTGTLVINSDASLGDAQGAFTVSLGTVSFTGAVTSSRTWVLNGPAYVNDNGHNSTLTGVIENGGSLQKAGAGVMELGGTNVYSGGTALDAGTLRIDNASAIGSGALTFNGGAFQFNGTSITLSVPVTIKVGGGAFDTMGNYAALSGVLSGAGGLTMTSTGTLALTNSNSYAGGTSVTGGGILNVGQDAALGAAGTAVTLSGGSTLQFSGSFDTSRPITLGAGGGVIDTNGENSNLSGIISGAGAWAP